jgi:hypothetical protein
MASTSKDAIDGYFEPCLIALGRVLDALSPFSDALVLIGGWAPWMLLKKYSNGQAEHTGSSDLDIAFDYSKIGPDARQRIEQALYAIGCKDLMHPDAASLPLGWSYLLPVEHDGRTVPVQIDLLGLEDAGQAKLSSDMALAFAAVEVVPLKVKRRNMAVRVSGAAAIVAMKARLLEQRSASKDAADLVTLVRAYRDGPRSVAAELRPLMNDRYMRGAIAVLRRQFNSERGAGPRAVANFYLPDAPVGEQAPLRAEAYRTIRQLLDLLPE